MTPSHYVGDGGLEAMDVMLSFMGPERYAGFLEGNVIKYILRWRSKGGVEDLVKCRDYIDELIAVESVSGIGV